MSEKVWNQREAWQKELEELEAAHAKLLSLPEPPGHHKPLRTERIIQLKRWLKDSDPERPVSPATTTREIEIARDWLRSREVQAVRWKNAHPESQMSQEDRMVYLLEAYASSQSEKLLGIGQEAAEKINELHNLTDDYDADVASIIDKLVAERLAK